ncbi:MAG: thioredoxin family protein [Pseudomonadota bacterium]
MKTLLAILALALISLMPAAFADEHSKMGDKIMEKAHNGAHVVVFYSDTCGSCKIMDPVMKEAMGALNAEKYQVVKFDFSTAETIEATKTLAAEKNVDAVLQKYGAKTGFAIVLNSNGEEVGKLTKADNSAEMAAKISGAILGGA